MSEQTELLYVEWQRLTKQWAATQDQWNDQAATKFERDCWQECEQVAMMLLQAMEDLDEEMNRALLNIYE